MRSWPATARTKQPWNEHGAAFNRQFFTNGKLWTALLDLLLQVTVVQWGPAQAVFDTVALKPLEWGLAFAVAASVLLLEEARKLLFTT